MQDQTCGGLQGQPPLPTQCDRLLFRPGFPCWELCALGLGWTGLDWTGLAGRRFSGLKCGWAGGQGWSVSALGLVLMTEENHVHEALMLLIVKSNA